MFSINLWTLVAFDYTPSLQHVSYYELSQINLDAKSFQLQIIAFHFNYTIILRENFFTKSIISIRYDICLCRYFSCDCVCVSMAFIFYFWYSIPIVQCNKQLSEAGWIFHIFQIRISKNIKHKIYYFVMICQLCPKYKWEKETHNANYLIFHLNNFNEYKLHTKLTRWFKENCSKWFARAEHMT